MKAVNKWSTLNIVIICIVQWEDEWMYEKTQQSSLFLENLLMINQMEAGEILENLYRENGDIKTIENVIVSSLQVIGDGWESGEYSLAQVYMAGIICEEIFDKMFPETKVKRIDSPKLGICVYLDHHGLGKRIVKSVVRSSGYEIIDIGQGLNTQDIVNACLENNFDILLVSTLMLSSALKLSEVKAQFSENGIKTKIIAGGAPFRFDSTLWKKIGVDADGGDATGIISVIEGMVKH